MKLDNAQNRIIKSKALYSLVKGKTGRGKTTVAAYRSVFLKNNYCLYNNDRVLIITNEVAELENFKKVYKEVSKEAEFIYLSLLEPKDNVIDVTTIRDVVDEIEKLKAINIEDQILIVKKVFQEIVKIYPEIKKYEDKNFSFLRDEIKWIKSCEYTTLNQYQNAERTVKKSTKDYKARRINRNSRCREAIFKLMLMYNDFLKDKGLIDEEDKICNAIKNLKKKNKYTHIIVDGIENFTKLQVSLIKALSNGKSYSTMFFTFNKDNIKDKNAWFVKSKNLNTILEYTNIKKYLLRNDYAPIKMIVKAIEKFQYNDLRHKTSFDFIRDIDNKTEIMLDSENVKFEAEEMNSIPVFSEIAAGEPIMMTPEVMDDFYMPKLWTKGAKDCFILKIKGDSMINVNINDGDYVVIKQEAVAQNNDIVAVDIAGSSTLKRLVIKKDQVLLMPENERYNPIIINEEEGARILGIAIGILKKIEV